MNAESKGLAIHIKVSEDYLEQLLKGKIDSIEVNSGLLLAGTSVDIIIEKVKVAHTGFQLSKSEKP